MVIFHSYVKLPEGNYWLFHWWFHILMFDHGMMIPTLFFRQGSSNRRATNWPRTTPGHYRRPRCYSRSGTWDHWGVDLYRKDHHSLIFKRIKWRDLVWAERYWKTTWEIRALRACSAKTCSSFLWAVDTDRVAGGMWDNSIYFAAL